MGSRICNRPELPKDIWTISKDKIIAESFEPYSHQFDNKSLIDSAIYILKDNTISITYPDGTVPYVINIIDSDTILLGDKKYGIETDLHVSKDDQLICFHDFSLKRKFKINKKIKDTNYSDLKKISKKKKSEIPLLKNLLKIEFLCLS